MTERTMFDPSRGVREQIFERIQASNGCTDVVCASYLSDHCACMDDYVLSVQREALKGVATSPTP